MKLPRHSFFYSKLASLLVILNGFMLALCLASLCPGLLKPWSEVIWSWKYETEQCWVLGVFRIFEHQHYWKIIITNKYLLDIVFPPRHMCKWRSFCYQKFVYGLSLSHPPAQLKMTSENRKKDGNETTQPDPLDRNLERIPPPPPKSGEEFHLSPTVKIWGCSLQTDMINFWI